MSEVLEDILQSVRLDPGSSADAEQRLYRGIERISSKLIGAGHKPFLMVQNQKLFPCVRGIFARDPYRIHAQSGSVELRAQSYAQIVGWEETRNASIPIAASVQLGITKKPKFWAERQGQVIFFDGEYNLGASDISGLGDFWSLYVGKEDICAEIETRGYPRFDVLYERILTLLE